MTEHISNEEITEGMTADKALHDALEESRRLNAEVLALLESSRAALEHREFKDAAQPIFNYCKNFIGATAGYIALLSEDGTRNEVVFLDSGGLPCNVDPDLPMPVRGLREKAYSTGRPVHENDFSKSEWVKFMPAGHASLENVLFAPVVIQGRAVGLIGIANKPGGFNADYERMTARFSELVAIALYNYRNLKSLENSKEALRRAHDELETRVEERTRELEKINEALQAEIEERKRAEEEREFLLKEIQNEQKRTIELAMNLKRKWDALELIMENTEAQLAYLDSEFNFIMVNSAYAKGSGKAKEELIGRNHFELFPNTENQAIFEKVRDSGEAVEFKAKPFEFAYQLQRGVTYWDWTLTPIKNEQGNVDRLVLSLVDVTESIRAVKAMERSLTYAESIVDTIRTPIVILDSNLRVLTANEAFYKLFRVTIEETKNRLFYDLCNGTWNKPELLKKLEKIIPENMDISGFEIEVECAAIGRRTMLLDAHRIYRKSIDSDLILLAIEDITERRKIEELFIENERLISANKSKSEFLAIVGHELRTPLTSIMGYSILLKEKAPGRLNKKQVSYVDNVLASSKHLIDIINNILEMGRIESGKLELVIENVSVAEEIIETLSLMKDKAEMYNIDLKKEIDPYLVFIEADKQKFRQILFNLLSNAIKFSKKGGGIVTVSAKKEGNFAKFSVSDNGIGIRKKDLPRLFQKFEQIDKGLSRKYEGIGLGLAITKQLVEMHEGKIMVESKYGKGSTFTFLMPISITKKKLFSRLNY